MFFRAAAFRADAFAARFLGGEVGGDTPDPDPAPAVQPTGGWSFPPDYGRSADERRREREQERERLEITAREQKKLDRAAKSIAKRVTARDAAAVETEIAQAREFDLLIADITARNSAVMEGLAALLLQSLMARVMQDLRDEDDAIAMLLLEM